MNGNDLFSMDKLVEFGMGMAVANQIANSMNLAINKMTVPGAGKTCSDVTESIYYVVMDHEVSGPYSLTEISRLIAAKKIVKETYVWKPGMKQWDLAENINEILKLVALVPPPVPAGM